MSNRIRKDVETESELQKLIEDTKKLRQASKPIYNPSVNLILNGMEIANYQHSGFPTSKEIEKVLEHCIPKYKPLAVVVDSSLRYLLSEDESIEFENYIKEGIPVKNKIIPIIEVGTDEDIILTILKFALDNNAKILTNQNLEQSYETIKQQKFPLSFKDKKFQVYYKITSSEITIFEQ